MHLLNPFLDNGIIKVVGRLSNAEIPESQRHPIVLPRNHHITRLLIREEHIRRLHTGTQATLYGVRENYWPINGKNVTRYIIRQCVTCFKARPRSIDYIMGNLPENQVTPARPFLNVGIDYCGPFLCLKRFFARRGKSKNIYSVDATNLLGVRNELKELYSVIQSAE